MSRPLEGIRVIAIEHFVAGPIGSMLLADWGAEVIRIERPNAGDPFRKMFQSGSDGKSIPVNFLIRNRNKKGVTLELKSDRGRELFLDLVRTADVVWENLAPDAMSKMNLGYAELRQANNRLIYASLSGFGHDDVLPGPYTERPAYDVVTQAMSGLMWLPSLGERPTWLGLPLTDLVPGIIAAAGVLLALRKRDQTGEGQRVDIALYDVAALLNERMVGLQAALGRTPSSEQLGVFKALDGYIAIGLIEAATWPLFFETIGQPKLAEDPALFSRKTRAGRVEAVVKPAISAWVGTRSRAEIVQKLLAIGIPAGPVQSVSEVLECPQLRVRQMFVQTDTEYGPITSVGNPVKMDAERYAASPPPRLGEHTDQILKELLGLPDEAIAKLRHDRVI